MFGQDSPSLSKHIPTERISCLCAFQIQTFKLTLLLLLCLNNALVRKWGAAYLQPVSCRIQQSMTSGSFCRGAAACPSTPTPKESFYNMLLEALSLEFTWLHLASLYKCIHFSQELQSEWFLWLTWKYSSMAFVTCVTSWGGVTRLSLASNTVFTAKWAIQKAKR